MKFKTWFKLFGGLAFFMAFPSVVLFFNIGVYFFIALFFYANLSLLRFSRNLKTDIPVWAILFGVGSVLSVLFVPDGFGSAAFLRSLSVLPNYLYWAVLILFFIKYRAIIDYERFRKYVFWGVTLYIPFWFVRENFLAGIPFLQKTSQNNLAFLMISYSCIAVSYVRSRQPFAIALLYFLSILLLMLFLGRRAGFMLVLLSGLLTLFVKKVGALDLLKYGFLCIVFWLAVQLPVVEKAVEAGSPRVHQMIYKAGEMMSSDRSFLTRLAMAEKGIYLFKKYPYTGVGLINFSRTEGEMAGDFEGARYVINKKRINELSAHNSYISALSEGGLVLFVPLVLLLLSVLVRFFMNIHRIDSNYYPLFWAFMSMIIHYSSIVGYVNAYSWFIIVMCSVVLVRLGEPHINNGRLQ